MLLSLLLLLFCLLALIMAVVLTQPELAARTVLRLTRRMLGLREASVQVLGLQIRYLHAGKGEPLVLLHGMGADKDNFLKVAAALSKHYRVIVPDLPGFGESDKPDQTERYSIESQVAFLHAFASQLELGPFDLGGNSMGGFIAGAYAAAHPAQVVSLWLLAPAGVKSAKPTELMRNIVSGGPLPILGRTTEDLRRIIRFVTCKPPYLPDFMIRAMAFEQDRQYELNHRIVQLLWLGPGLDDLLAAAALKTPTLIVWGLEDRALDYSGAEILHRLLPGSQLRLLADVGHLPQIEVPGLLVKQYLEFRRSQI